MFTQMQHAICDITVTDKYKGSNKKGRLPGSTSVACSSSPAHTYAHQRYVLDAQI
jgi:hypothetical protein